MSIKLIEYLLLLAGGTRWDFSDNQEKIWEYTLKIWGVSSEKADLLQKIVDQMTSGPYKVLVIPMEGL